MISTKPQLWAIFGSLIGFYMMFIFLFELLNAGGFQQQTPTEKPQGVPELLRFLVPPLLCCWLSLQEWHHAFKQSDHTSFIHRPPPNLSCPAGEKGLIWAAGRQQQLSFCSGTLYADFGGPVLREPNQSSLTLAETGARLCGELLSLALSLRPVIHVCWSWETGSRCRKKAPVWSRSPR